MAIANETSDYISQTPDETIIEDIKKTETVQPETVQPETVVTPSSTTTKPMFSKNERIGYTLLPLASALLQGKRTGGGSMFNDTLASLGQGLMGTTDVALKIKQLEGANKTKSGSALKQYKLQPDAQNPNKKVQVGGANYTPNMNKIFQLSVDDVNAYPPGTFVESSADKKGTLKTEKFDLTYVGSEEEAKRLYPNNPDIQKIITAPSDDLIGKPVIKDNQRLTADVIFRDGLQSESRIGFASKQPTGMRDIAKGTLEYQPDIATAKKYLADRGIKEGIEGYNYVLGKIVNKDLTGKLVFEGNAALVMSAEAPDVAGAPITSVNLVPEKDIKSFTFETRKG